MNQLSQEQCRPYGKDEPALSPEQAQQLLSQLSSGWTIEQNTLLQTFRLKNFDRTIELVNQIAHIATHQDHHPTLTITYNTCKVAWSTHSVQGLSANDFICAAKIDTVIAND